MKAGELKELRANNLQDLKARLNNLKARLLNLRFRLVTDQLENPVRIREIRKSIAQIKAIIREEETRAFEQ